MKAGFCNVPATNHILSLQESKELIWATQNHRIIGEYEPHPNSGLASFPEVPFPIEKLRKFSEYMTRFTLKKENNEIFIQFDNEYVYYTQRNGHAYPQLQTKDRYCEYDINYTGATPSSLNYRCQLEGGGSYNVIE